MIRILSQYVSPRRVLLTGLESAVILLALVCGVLLRFWNDPAGGAEYLASPEFAAEGLLFAVTFHLCLLYSMLYWPTRHPHEERRRLHFSLGVGCVLLGALSVTAPQFLPDQDVIFFSTVVLAVFGLASGFPLRLAWRPAAPRDRVLILGTGPLARTVAEQFAAREDLDVHVVGFYEPGNDASNSLSGLPVLGRQEDLAPLAKRLRVTRLIVAFESWPAAFRGGEFVRLRLQGLKVEDALSSLCILSGRVRLDTIQPGWLARAEGFQHSTLSAALKRAIDLVLGVIGLVVSSPLMLAVACAVRLDSWGPVLFRQTRTGRNGRPFELLKFRSMRVDAEIQGARWASKDDPRVTRIGHFLRKYRLDELPQFVNIVRGEMSLVGPRPERPVFVEQLTACIPYYQERHAVRPGLTGWAQVQFPYGASVEDSARKLEYDLFYLRNLSLALDVLILMKTVRTILAGWGGR